MNGAFIVHYISLSVLCGKIHLDCADLFQFIDNRECTGVSGRVCCDGFKLNEITRQCEKCPIGYHRNNCSEKCGFPVYGEDCQYLCDCNKNDCHFVTGCFHHVTTVTDHHQLTTHFDDFSPHDIDLIKENSVVRVIISLIGVFVFFFAIFVLTYIYFKCFRKTTTASGGVRKNEWQAQYKSLSFDAVEPQLIPLHPEPQGRVNTDFTYMYLTPVFSRNESRESRCTGENDRRNENEIIPDTHLQEQRVISLETISRQNEPNIAHGGGQEHVYIEITEEKTESSKLDADPVNENKRVTYTNANKEEL